MSAQTLALEKFRPISRSPGTGDAVNAPVGSLEHSYVHLRVSPRLRSQLRFDPVCSVNAGPRLDYSGRCMQTPTGTQLLPRVPARPTCPAGPTGASFPTSVGPAPPLSGTVAPVVTGQGKCGEDSSGIVVGTADGGGCPLPHRCIVGGERTGFLEQ